MSSFKHTIGVVGLSGCGKSTLLHKFLKHPSSSYPRMTIGFNILLLDEFNLFYDFSGSPQFSFLLEKYVNLCNSFLLCYDNSRSDSLKYIEDLLFSKNGLVNKPILLVGLKKDLLSDITEKRLNNLFQKYHIDYHCCVSSTQDIEMETFASLFGQVCKFTPQKNINLDKKAHKMSPLLLGQLAAVRGRRLSYCDKLRNYWR
jgi:GTPase SAR1 family protein